MTTVFVPKTGLSVGVNASRSVEVRPGGLDPTGLGLSGGRAGSEVMPGGTLYVPPAGTIVGAAGQGPSPFARGVGDRLRAMTPWISLRNAGKDQPRGGRAVKVRDSDIGSGYGALWSLVEALLAPFRGLFDVADRIAGGLADMVSGVTGPHFALADGAMIIGAAEASSTQVADFSRPMLMSGRHYWPAGNKRPDGPALRLVRGGGDPDSVHRLLIALSKGKTIKRPGAHIPAIVRGGMGLAQFTGAWPLIVDQELSSNPLDMRLLMLRAAVTDKGDFAAAVKYVNKVPDEARDQIYQFGRLVVLMIFEDPNQEVLNAFSEIGTEHILNLIEGGPIIFTPAPVMARILDMVLESEPESARALLLRAKYGETGEEGAPSPIDLLDRVLPDSRGNEYWLARATALADAGEAGLATVSIKMVINPTPDERLEMVMTKIQLLKDGMVLEESATAEQNAENFRALMDLADEGLKIVNGMEGTDERYVLIKDQLRLQKAEAFVGLGDPSDGVEILLSVIERSNDPRIVRDSVGLLTDALMRAGDPFPMGYAETAQTGALRLLSERIGSNPVDISMREALFQFLERTRQYVQLLVERLKWRDLLSKDQSFNLMDLDSFISTWFSNGEELDRILSGNFKPPDGVSKAEMLLGIARLADTAYSPVASLWTGSGVGEHLSDKDIRRLITAIRACTVETVDRAHPDLAELSGIADRLEPHAARDPERELVVHFPRRPLPPQPHSGYAAKHRTGKHGKSPHLHLRPVGTPPTLVAPVHLIGGGRPVRPRNPVVDFNEFFAGTFVLDRSFKATMPLGEFIAYLGALLLTVDIPFSGRDGNKAVLTVSRLAAYIRIRAAGREDETEILSSLSAMLKKHGFTE